MARTITNVKYSCTFDEAQKKVEAILNGKGFHQTTLKNGENVWKKGNGILTAMQFIKVEYARDSIQLSAWTQVGLGSVGGKEMDLSGVTAAIPKQSLKKVLDTITAAF